MKLRAFTLWELLISIVILSSIVSIVYVSYLKSEKLMSNEENRLIELDTLINLEKTLSDMFDEAKIIYSDGDYVVFSFRDLDKYISIEDSVMIVWDDNSEKLLTIPVIDMEYDFLNQEDDFIKGMTIHLGQRFFGSTITLKKTYTNQFLLNNQ